MINNGKEYKKLVHVQTILFEDDIRELKKRTKTTSVKDAVSIAVEHYLECYKIKMGIK